MTDINDLMDECINHLCDDSAECGAESLAELAHEFAKAGFPQQTFTNIRSHCINTAIERLGPSSAMFINYKLQEAEQKLTRQRNGESRLIITH